MFRFRDRLKFILERWLQRGALAQLAFIAGVIVLIAFLGGIVAWAFSGEFTHLDEAVWWAFLRLSDPGYLGDDEGVLLRTIATVVTLLGYVVFVGSLVAILTQWLDETMERLESGLTPIAIRDHVLILGWTNRTPAIIQELLLSEGRVRRFLRNRGLRSLRIVVLAEHVDAALYQELRDELGSRRFERQVVLRSGTSLRVEHLRRVAYRNASVIIVPGADFFLGGAKATDARVVKTLISLSSSQRGSRPSVVAEIFDTEKTEVAVNAYPSGEIDVIASDGFISRLIAQNVRHRGLSYIYSELLTHSRGNEIYINRFPEWAGESFGTLFGRFKDAILIGIVRPDENRFQSHLNAPPDMKLGPDDRLVFLARAYDHTVPSNASRKAHPKPMVASPAEPPDPSTRRILILGWSHKVAALVQEFAGYSTERFEIDVLSRIEVGHRNLAPEEAQASYTNITLRQIYGDYTDRGTLASMAPSDYDNIVFLASDWLETEEESDARTILGYILLRSLISEEMARPEVLIELLDPDNARLFRRRSGEVIISPVILSHILAHVALRRELATVFTELFGPAGSEFYFRPAADYELVGQSVAVFDIREAARSRGEIAIGLRVGSERDRYGGGVYLNPDPDRRWEISSDDEIIVLATG